MKRNLILVASLLPGLLAGPAHADFSVEGSADDLVVVADGASRSAVVADLLSMLGIEAAGEDVIDAVITGRYEGELSRVLHQLVPDNGFVIGHADGRPRRIVFSGPRSSSAPPATIPDPSPQTMEMPSSPFEPTSDDGSDRQPAEQPQDEWTVPPPESPDDSSFENDNVRRPD
ncbi:MAG: hypothetical protein ACXIVF_13550 [Rhizobiaceae bacterium]